MKQSRITREKKVGKCELKRKTLDLHNDCNKRVLLNSLRDILRPEWRLPKKTTLAFEKFLIVDGNSWKRRGLLKTKGTLENEGDC